eukprot:TRINITY_DN67798_c0_g1_i1.p1 TRINITY_DN67798_c0_g1~~TRINITY_DN67798_c0_g1_i1.p1  ORF type:complete len:254 (+),score=20.54 TRINITY_DN67798_c0_g1_i1:55-816(+)
MGLRESLSKWCDACAVRQATFQDGFAQMFRIGEWRLVFSAPLTLWLEMICSVLFFLYRKGFISEDVYDVFRSPSSSEFLDLNLLSFPRLILHSFGHGVDEKLLLKNMTAFLLVLPLLEEKYKIRWLVLISIFNALVTSAFALLFNKCVYGSSGLVIQCVILSVFSGRSSNHKDIPATLLIAVMVYVVPDHEPEDLAHLFGGIAGALAALSTTMSRVPDEVFRAGSFPPAPSVPARTEMAARQSFRQSGRLGLW